MTQYVRLFHLLRKRINPKALFIISSSVIGIVSALVAVLLKQFVSEVHHLVKWLNSFSENYYFFIFPAAGILLTVLYARIFHRGTLGRGVSSILFAILRKNGNVEKEKTYSHVISSSLTVGFGGSAGLEAPIVVTGSAIGSNASRLFGFTGTEKKILLASGAASGIAAVFNAPMAGVIFAIEVLLPEITIPAFVPLLIATASASVVSNLFYSDQLFFLITTGWHYPAIPFYILLGVICGFISVYLTRVNEVIENFFKNRKSVFRKAVGGGIFLGFLIFLIPPLYGEGYDTIKALLREEHGSIVANSLFQKFSSDAWFLLALAGGIVLIKIVATAVTIGSGGNGGIFAPSLFTGAMLGYTFARFFTVAGVKELVIPNFMVAGMAGLLSGVVHAPLTAIFLIAEISGGYTLLIPLMITASLSFFIARFFEPHSLYTKQLARKGLLEKDPEKDMLRKVHIRQLLETDFIPVHESEKLSDILTAISHSKRNLFPVTDESGNLKGIIFLDSIREHMFNPEMHDLPVTEFIATPPAILDIEENAYKSLKKFDRTGSWNLPVTEEGKYVGFLSKGAILQAFREKLNKKIDQTVRHA